MKAYSYILQRAAYEIWEEAIQKSWFWKLWWFLHVMETWILSLKTVCYGNVTMCFDIDEIISPKQCSLVEEICILESGRDGYKFCFAHSSVLGQILRCLLGFLIQTMEIEVATSQGYREDETM